MKEVVSFANAQGGLLLIGVDDNLTIPGLPNPDEEEYVLARAITELVNPPITYRVERVHVGDEQFVLIYHISPGQQKPYYVQPIGKQLQPRSYVRVKDHAVQASRELREILRQQTKGKPLRFQFGDKERLLMEHLTRQPSITLKEFAALAQVPDRLASRTLVLLVASHVLRIEPDEREDRYVLAEGTPADS
jgi:predicted HTH transcriptional regulator